MWKSTAGNWAIHAQLFQSNGRFSHDKTTGRGAHLDEASMRDASAEMVAQHNRVTTQKKPGASLALMRGICMPSCRLAHLGDVDRASGGKQHQNG